MQMTAAEKAASDKVKGIDISDLELALQARKKQLKSNKTGAALKAKPEVEAFIKEKWGDIGLTLADVFTASDKPIKQYKNPDDGAIWSGKGKMPAWLKQRGPKERAECLLKD